MRIIGIGVDLVKVSRIEDAIEKWNERFLRRIFTSGEIDYCRKSSCEAIRFAARFAAKEAVKKAVGERIRWNNVEVLNEEAGKPVVRLVGAEVSLLKDKWQIFLSMSHTDEYALAYVVIQGKKM